MNGMQYLSTSLNEIKVDASSNDMSFSGYGAVFGNMDYQGDVIVPGAFAESLAEAKNSGIWPSMLSQHGGFGGGDNIPIGVWTSLSEDGIGLRVEGKLAPTARGQEYYALMKMTPRPAIDGMSIGYRIKTFEPRTKPEEPARKLIKLDLREISLVTFPANTRARVNSVKSDLTKRFAEKCLIEAGFSKEEAKIVLSKGYDHLSQREVGSVENALEKTIARRDVAETSEMKDRLSKLIQSLRNTGG